MPVGEMLRRFTSPELTELMALHDLRAKPEPPQQTVAEARAVLSGMARKRKAP